MKFRWIVFIALTLLLTVFVSDDSLAQCAMCKGQAEQSIEGGSYAARTLNAGILYLLAMPFILVSVILFLWRRNRKKTEAAA